MLDAVKKIYNAQELPGEEWVQPLKQYHGFFARKVEANSGLTKAAAVIANIFTGVIAYPLAGLLAGVGVLVKLTGVHGVTVHNRAKKAELETFVGDLKKAETFVRSSPTNASCPVEWKKTPIREFQLTKINIDQMKHEIDQEIDQQTQHFKKIYYEAVGMIRKDVGTITLQLQIMEKA
jgi:hypothetical protein